MREYKGTRDRKLEGAFVAHGKAGTSPHRSCRSGHGSVAERLTARDKGRRGHIMSLLAP